MEPHGSGVGSLIKARLFSFGMVLAVGFLLLVSLVITAGLAVLGKFFGEILPMPELLMHTINFVVSFAGISALFALIFKYVPEARIKWKDVWEGAIATALLFTIGKSLIGLYLGKAAVGSTYGAAGSLILVIVWVYYSAMIFFFARSLRMCALLFGKAPTQEARVEVSADRGRTYRQVLGIADLAQTEADSLPQRQCSVTRWTATAARGGREYGPREGRPVGSFFGNPPLKSGLTAPLSSIASTEYPLLQRSVQL